MCVKYVLQRFGNKLHFIWFICMYCPMMVEIGKCNSHIRNFFQSLMQKTIHFHFEKTHFVIICYVWDGCKSNLFFILVNEVS